MSHHAQSTSTPAGDGPTTAGEFDKQLGAMLRTAYRNGVDVEGGWQYRDGQPEAPDWGVEVYGVTRPSRGAPVSATGRR